MNGRKGRTEGLMDQWVRRREEEKDGWRKGRG